MKEVGQFIYCWVDMAGNGTTESEVNHRMDDWGTKVLNTLRSGWK